MKNHRKTILIAAAFVLAVWTRSLAAQPLDDVPVPEKLHLADALRLHREHGLELILAEAAVQSARGDLLQARVAPNPQLSAGVGRAMRCSDGVSCSPYWNAGISDQSALFDTLSGKRRLRTDVADLALQVAHMGQADAQRTLEARLRQTYLATVSARQSLAAQVEAQGTLAHLAALNRARFERGAISEVDVLKVETEKLNADQDVERAQQVLDASKADLAALMGVRRSVHFDVDDGLPAFRVPPLLTQASVDSLLAEARANRPDLKAARLNDQRAEALLRSSRRLRFPDIAISAGISGLGNGNDPNNPTSVSLGLSLTPPLFNRYEGEIAKAHADILAQEAQLARTEAQIVDDVQSAFAQWTSARNRVERAQRELLERARRTRDLVQIQYDKGAASLLEYLDAERVFIASKLDYANDLADYWQAVVLIGQAIGEDLGP